MIRYSKEEGLIKPLGLRFNEGQDKNIVLPHVGVGVFSRHLYDEIIAKFSCKEIGYINNANFDRKVYIMRYKDVEITLFMAGVGGPLMCADIEELNAHGVDTFIIFGNCGVLDSKIKDCSVIIPTKAFREDGASYHYVEDSDTIDMNPDYMDIFLEILKEHNFDYTKGYTWTTDAFYRETKDKMDYFKSNGAVCVEMEGSVIAATCKRKGLKYFTFYYAGDNLDSVEWDERSLYGDVNIDKKNDVAILAFELAYRLLSR
jgi:uridine phosphorylase